MFTWWISQLYIILILLYLCYIIVVVIKLWRTSAAPPDWPGTFVDFRQFSADSENWSLRIDAGQTWRERFTQTGLKLSCFEAQVLNLRHRKSHFSWRVTIKDNWTSSRVQAGKRPWHRTGCSRPPIRSLPYRWFKLRLHSGGAAGLAKWWRGFKATVTVPVNTSLY